MLILGEYTMTDVRKWEERAPGCKVVGWCECEDLRLSRTIDVEAWDHVFDVEDARGTKLHLLQPFAFDFAKAKELEAWCVKNGYWWKCWGGDGFWHPWTISILVIPNPVS